MHHQGKEFPLHEQNTEGFGVNALWNINGNSLSDASKSKAPLPAY